MSTDMKTEIWDVWGQSKVVIAHEPAAAEPSRQNTSEFLKEPSSAVENERSATVVKESLGDLRHSRRRPIRSNAEIVDWHCVQVKPDVTTVVDASPDGILFQSDRKYRAGMELLVRFPFPCASSPKQRGTVVRIDEQLDGNSHVAVKFG